MSRREPTAPVVWLALALGALDLALIMISLLFMWVNAGVLGWYAVAWGTGVFALMLESGSAAKPHFRTKHISCFQTFCSC